MQSIMFYQFTEGNGNNEEKIQTTTNEEESEIKRRSTRKWAEEVQYDPAKLFSKV